MDLYELGIMLSFLRKLRVPPDEWNSLFIWEDIALEIGCGTGEYSVVLKQKHHTIIGLEISLTFLKTHFNNSATKQLADHLVCASADYLPFKDKSVDVAYSCDVIHHIPLKIQPRFFKECKRVFKKHYMPLEMRLTGFPLVFTTIADQLQKMIWGYDYDYDRSIFYKHFKFKKHKVTFMYDWFVADCCK